MTGQSGRFLVLAPPKKEGSAPRACRCSGVPKASSTSRMHCRASRLCCPRCLARATSCVRPRMRRRSCGSVTGANSVPFTIGSSGGSRSSSATCPGSSPLMVFSGFCTASKGSEVASAVPWYFFSFSNAMFLASTERVRLKRNSSCERACHSARCSCSACQRGTPRIDTRFSRRLAPT